MEMQVLELESGMLTGRSQEKKCLCGGSLLW